MFDDFFDKYLIVFISSFCVLGILLSFHIDFPLIFLLLALINFIIFSFVYKKRSLILFILSLLLISFVIGIIRGGAETDFDKEYSSFLNKKVFVEGNIIGDIELKNNRERYQVQISKIDNIEQVEKVKILVYENFLTICNSGDAVSFEATIKPPKNFLTDSGRVFDYKKYLRKEGIFGVAFLNNSPCDSGDDNKDNKKGFFVSIRENFANILIKTLPKDEAGLLGGLLLGLKTNLSDELLNQFRIVGLIHIIVLSGFNVSIVGEGVRRIFLFLSTKYSLFLSVFAVIFFVILSGSEIPAVRSGGMIVLGLIAKALHREADGVKFLFLVSMIMALYNPYQVLFSTSFHLSFLATVSLLLYSDKIAKYLTFIPEKYELRGIVSVTFAVQLFLIPYFAFAIGEVSVIGFFANLIVLPLIPIIMLLGAILILLSVVFLPLGKIFSVLVLLPLSFVLLIVSTLSALPFATISLPEVSALIIFIFYFGVILYSLTKQAKSKTDPLKLDF